jgi:hypothetical protein
MTSVNSDKNDDILMLFFKYNRKINCFKKSKRNQILIFEIIIQFSKISLKDHNIQYD